MGKSIGHVGTCTGHVKNKTNTGHITKNTCHAERKEYIAHVGKGIADEGIGIDH